MGTYIPIYMKNIEYASHSKVEIRKYRNSINWGDEINEPKMNIKRTPQACQAFLIANHPQNRLKMP